MRVWRCTKGTKKPAYKSEDHAYRDTPCSIGVPHLVALLSAFFRDSTNLQLLADGEDREEGGCAHAG